MATLKSVLAEKIPLLRADIKKLIAEHGEEVISEVKVAQAYGGMRGVRVMVSVPDEARSVGPPWPTAFVAQASSLCGSRRALAPKRSSGWKPEP